MLITVFNALETTHTHGGIKVMYDRGFYSYKDKNKDIKTCYTVEWTRDQKVLDIMGTVKFDFSMLDKRQFDYLEDAVSLWNKLYYEETVLHVMLFEEIILDGETILEQCKDMVVPSVLDKISEQRVRQAETAMEEYKKENDLFRKFLAKYHIDMKRVIKETEETNNDGTI